MTGEANSWWDPGKTSRGLQYDWDHGKGGGTDTVCDCSLSRMSKNESSYWRDEAVSAWVRPRSKGRLWNVTSGTNGTVDRLDYQFVQILIESKLELWFIPIVK